MVEELFVAPVEVFYLVAGGLHRHFLINGFRLDGAFHPDRHLAQNCRGLIEIHFHHNTHKTQIAYLQNVLLRKNTVFILNF